MIRMGRTCVLFLLLTVPAGRAHEPVFGLGPHTLYQYGYAISTEFERREASWIHHLEVIYGVTPDLSVTGVVPYHLGNGGTPAGWGDIVTRMKYRFYRQDRPGSSLQAAVHAGTKFPTGDATTGPGSGFRTMFLGLSFGYESRRHYVFAGLRHLWHGSRDGLQPGNQLIYNAAYGIRPWKLEYYQPDPVLIFEIQGTITRPTRQDGRELGTSGRHLIAAGPALLFSYRNVMLKAGVSMPLRRSTGEASREEKPELVFGLEWHMPPLR